MAANNVIVPSATDDDIPASSSFVSENPIQSEMSVKVDVEDEDEVVAEVVAQDENEDQRRVASYEVADDFPLREIQVGNVLRLNPCVTLIGAGILIALAVYCMVDPNSNETMRNAQTWVTVTFTWLYIASQNVWLVFYAYIVYKHGHIKLGADDEKPEFSDLAYFSMLFCAGIGGGVFYFGSSEPLYHYTEQNRISTLREDEKAMEAMNLTLFHWGLHGWIVYSVIASILGHMSYRKGLPLTMRSCLYPLLGRHTWGWIGDCVDGLTIVTCVAGVCTSLGLSAKQFESGLVLNGILEPLDDPEELKWRKIAIIWIITAAATASLVSGLNVGIKFLSQFAFACGMFLSMSIFVLDHTWYILNLHAQLTGYYANYILKLGWFTDAFSQLRDGQGRAVVEIETASETWQDYWTVFYWGWWVAWAPFVGLFLARISRGRTLREVFTYTLSIPLAYAIMWTGIVGGSSLRMYRRYLELFALAQKDTETMLEMFGVEGEPTCFEPTVEQAANYSLNWEFEISPVCNDISDKTWFYLVKQYNGVGQLLSLVSLVAILIYFVTSSDSGSLVVDTMASNGRDKHHPLQRVFWACIEGAVAHALVQASGEEGLKALRAASIVTGLPYTMLFCVMMMAWYRALEYDGVEFTTTEEDSANHIHLKKWSVFGTRQFNIPLQGGVFDFGEVIFSLGRLHPGRGAVFPTMAMVKDFAVGLCAPFLGANIAMRRDTSWSKRTIAFQTVTIGASFAVSMVLLIGGFGMDHNVQMLGFVVYLFFAFMLSQVRTDVRQSHDIAGNVFEDLFASLFMYPQVVAQLIGGVEEHVPVLKEE